jgi:signal transduction histidine kinase/DNA-binding response OmpR family regulator
MPQEYLLTHFHNIIQTLKEALPQCSAGSIMLMLCLLLSGAIPHALQQAVAQQHVGDSLQLRLRQVNGAQKIETLKALSLHCRADSVQRAIHYAKEALVLAQAIDYLKGEVESSYILGAALLADGNHAAALLNLQQGLERAEQLDNPTLLAEGNYQLGLYYQQVNQLRFSLEYFNKGLALAKQHKNKHQMAACYAQLGSNYHSLSLYETALANLFKALSIHEELQDVKEIARDYNYIGRLYQYTKDYSDALSYFNKSFHLYTSLKEEKGRMAALLNIGVIYQKRSVFDSALLYYKIALPIAGQLGQKSDEAKLTGNIGSTLVQQGRLQQGLEWLEQALAMKEKIQAHRSILHTLNDISDVKLKLDDAAGAWLAAEKVVRLAKQYEDGNQLRYGYLNLAKSYEKLNDYEKAYDYLQQYDAIKDSLFGIDKAQQINQLQIQYETEKKDRAIASLQQEREMEALKQKNFFAVGAILLIAGALLYNSQRLKTKKHRQLLAKEKEVDRLKLNFFANISHEFRTPLTLILGPIESMQAQTREPFMRQQLGFMKESASRLLRLVNQILDLSKAEAGHLVLKPEPVNILPVLKGITGSFSSMAETRHIRLLFQTKLEEQELCCEQAHIETVLINLLSNAFKFSEAGGQVCVQVDVVFLPDPKYPDGALEIVVSDKGAGISAEQVAHIFDRFYQAGHAATGFFGGTGIGLALTKELVQLHGGTVEVSSELGRGTTITVCIPLGKAHFGEEQLAEVQLGEEVPVQEEIYQRLQKELEQQYSPHPAAEGDSSKKLPILLLVEDNEDVRVYIRTILSADYTIVEAVNGEEGLLQAYEHIPDIIISDVMMPKMNGYEVCRMLKQDERTSHIPVILLTAKASVHSRIEGLETKADLYLSKPFVPRELHLCLKNLVQSRIRLRERYQKQLVLKPSELAVNSVDEMFLERLMQVMEVNYDNEEFTVEQLSQEIGISRSQLHRKLEALTNESSSQFIRKFRLQRAMELLKKNHASISEIAYMVGFGSPSYFNRCFLKQYGVTPSSVLGA